MVLALRPLEVALERSLGRTRRNTYTARGVNQWSAHNVEARGDYGIEVESS
jgi:hypothetical protein